VPIDDSNNDDDDNNDNTPRHISRNLELVRTFCPSSVFYANVYEDLRACRHRPP